MSCRACFTPLNTKHTRAYRDIKYTRVPIFFSIRRLKHTRDGLKYLCSPMHCCILLSPQCRGLCTCVYTCLLSSSDEIESQPGEVSGAQRNKSWWPIRCSISLCLSLLWPQSSITSLIVQTHLTRRCCHFSFARRPERDIQRDTYRNSPSANK